MRREFCELVCCPTALSSREMPAPQDGPSYYYASSNPPPSASASTAAIRSSSTVTQSSDGVQSYQTIGGAPVYAGAGVPGYVPNQP